MLITHIWEGGYSSQTGMGLMGYVAPSRRAGFEAAWARSSWILAGMRKMMRGRCIRG